MIHFILAFLIKTTMEFLMESLKNILMWLSVLSIPFDIFIIYLILFKLKSNKDDSKKNEDDIENTEAYQNMLEKMKRRIEEQEKYENGTNYF
jgi:hypothetical protein